MFVEKYVPALNTSDLRDDEHHHAPEVLRAASYANGQGSVLGTLLSRAKFADGTPCKTFEAGTRNLAELLRVWKAAVHAKGADRKWLPIVNAWDIPAALTLYDKVAEASLAYWLDGSCAECHGAKVNKDRRVCGVCAGTGRAPIEGGRLVVDLTKDMVSELEGLFQAHGSRATSILRRVA